MFSSQKNRFISQYHTNLAKITSEHLKKQKDLLNKRILVQVDQNEEIREKIKASQEENRCLQNEAEKYKLVRTTRNEDYERIKIAIANEVEDMSNKVPEITFRGELKESKTRELEVRIDNEKNKLSTELQKVGIVEDEVGLQIIEINTLEEQIKNAKDKILKINQNINLHKEQLLSTSLQQKQVQKKYNMSKGFVENIDGINDQLKQSMDLVNRETRSLLFSKAVHEKFNSRLINIIIMNNIPHDTTALRQMMTKLDDLNSELYILQVKTETNVYALQVNSFTSDLPNNQEHLRKSCHQKKSSPMKFSPSSKRRHQSNSSVEKSFKDVNIQRAPDRSSKGVYNVLEEKSCVRLKAHTITENRHRSKCWFRKRSPGANDDLINEKSCIQFKSPSRSKKRHQSKKSAKESFKDVKIPTALNKSSGDGHNVINESSCVRFSSHSRSKRRPQRTSSDIENLKDVEIHKASDKSPCGGDRIINEKSCHLFKPSNKKSKRRCQSREGLIKEILKSEIIHRSSNRSSGNGDSVLNENAIICERSKTERRLLDVELLYRNMKTDDNTSDSSSSYLNENKLKVVH